VGFLGPNTFVSFAFSPDGQTQGYEPYILSPAEVTLGVRKP